MTKQKPKAIKKGLIAATIASAVLVAPLVGELVPSFLNEASAKSYTEEEIVKLIATAEEKVSTAEKKLTTSSLSSANSAVKKLPEGEAKVGFTLRLEIVQAQIATLEAETALEALVKNPTSTNLKKLEKAIAKFAEGEDKDKYTAKYNEYQEQITKAELAKDIAAVEYSVSKAESLLSSSRISSAQRLIDKLPEGEAKVAFQTRLDAAKIALDIKVQEDAYVKADLALKNLAIKVTSSNISKAETAILKVEDATKREELYKRFSELVGDATDEAEKKSYDEAVAALVKLENDLKSSLFSSTENKINKVLNPTQYFELVERFETAKAATLAHEANIVYEEAVEKVSKVETTMKSSYVNAAQSAINKVSDSVKKAELQLRLDAAVKEMASQAEQAAYDYAVTKIVKVETTLKSTYVKTAQLAIDKVSDSTKNAELQARLDKAVQTINDSLVEKINADALKAVETAEQKKTQSYVNSAKRAIDKVTNVELKAELVARLNVVIQTIEGVENQKNLEAAIKAVEAAEKYETSSRVKTAKTALAKLVDGDVKDGLTARLDVVIQIVFEKEQAELFEDATKAIERADELLTDSSIAIAEKKIAGVSDVAVKESLTQALNAVKEKISNKDYHLALNAIEKAETALSDTSINNAQKLVNAVDDETKKAELQTRLDAVKAKIEDAESAELVKKAEEALAKFEKSLSESTMKSAEKAILAIKDEVKRAELLAVFEIAKNTMNNEEEKEAQEEALTAVEKAEKYVTASYVKTAEKKIAEVTNETVKAELTNRLNVVKKAVESKEIAESIEDAEKALEKALKYLSSSYISSAERAIEKVLDAEKKALFEGQLENIKKAYAEKVEAEAFEDAMKSIEKAAAKPTATNIKNAERDIEKVTNPESKAQLMKLLDELKEANGIK